MPRLTDRDKKFYDFLVKTRLPITSQDVSLMFYNTGNSASSMVVANRRLKKLKEMQYIDVMPRKFSEQCVYYVGQKPNSKSLRHRLLQSHIIAVIASNGFEVLDIEIEKPLIDGLRCDNFLTIAYNGKKYNLIIEIDLQKQFNTDGYTKLIHQLQNREIVFDYPLLIMSISDFKIESDVKKYVITLKTDLSDFSKFVFQFIK